LAREIARVLFLVPSLPLSCRSPCLSSSLRCRSPALSPPSLFIFFVSVSPSPPLLLSFVHFFFVRSALFFSSNRINFFYFLSPSFSSSPLIATHRHQGAQSDLQKEFGLRTVPYWNWDTPRLAKGMTGTKVAPNCPSTVAVAYLLCDFALD